MTQTKMVLAYLENYDAITSFEAFTELGVTRLACVIYNLRKAGHIISYSWVTDKNRYGKKVRYKRYRLEEKCEQK